MISIIVFWLRSDGTPASADLSKEGLDRALKYAHLHRSQGMRHVTISTENADQVGRPGVDSIADGKTPDGHSYEWSKAGRAGKVRRGDVDKEPRDGKNL